MTRFARPRFGRLAVRPGPRRVAARAVQLVLVALVALAGQSIWSSCAQNQGDDQAEDAPAGHVTRLPEARPPLSKNLMLGLALAKNLHHKADVYLKEARVADAVATVKQILDIKFPADSPEGEEVVLDARARLAKLLMTQGDLDQARTVIDDGISGASRQSFFLANLYTVRGELWEASAAQAEHDSARAREAQKQAIAAYDKAIAIDNDLLEQVSQAAEQPAPGGAQ